MCDVSSLKRVEMFSNRTLFAFVVIAIAFYYGKRRKLASSDQDHVDQAVIDAWNSQISKPQNQFQRIAVG